MLGFSFVPSLLISSVALYAAYRHNPQHIYFNYETRDVNFWVCAEFLLLNFAAFFIGIMMIELALWLLVFLIRRFGERRRAGSQRP